jgi:hypothetical protein
MKNIFLLITLTLLITSCGGDSTSVESIVESNDLTKIRKKRDDLAAKQNDLNFMEGFAKVFDLRNAKFNL